MNNQLLEVKTKIENSERTNLKFEWRIPLFRDNIVENYKKVERANRYLKHQDIKISKMIEDGQYERAEVHFHWMIRTSKSLKVYAFNRQVKGWYYGRSINQVRRFWKRFLKISKTLPLGTKISRIYIPKKNGKLRPLGVPSIPDRVLNALWAKFLAVCHEEDECNQSQHAYHSNKGAHTAWMEIIELSRQGYRMFEYDFQAFFNTIRPTAVYDELIERFKFKGLTNYIMNVNINTVPEISKLEKEVEYRRLSNFEILKSGLPQGMPWSGILAMIVLDGLRIKVRSVMYSDDGVLFFKKDEDLNTITETPKFKRSGIEFAWDKCKWVDQEIKFLGLTFDLVNRKLLIGDRWFPADKLNVNTLKELLAGKDPYTMIGKEKVNWEWEINPSSWLAREMKSSNIIEEPVWKWIEIAARYLWLWVTGRDTRGKWRIYGFRLYEYNKLSTQSCSWLLEGGLKESASIRKSRIKRCKRKRNPNLRKLEEIPAPRLDSTYITVGNERIKLHHYQPWSYPGKELIKIIND